MKAMIFPSADKNSNMATKTKKPPTVPTTPFPPTLDSLHQVGNWLWIPLRKEWRDVATKPEEIVRQKFIRVLVEHYGYDLAQIDQERRTQHGHKSPRADIVLWQSAADKNAKPVRAPVLVVECKTDSIEIQERDYYQGESYTRASGCEFFVATNTRHTLVFRLLPGLPGGFVAINEIPKATDWGDAKRLKEIKESLRAFNRKEFQDLLFVCHSILRDVHKMDPGRAFDTISKILFIKMYVERSGLHGTFTLDYLDKRAGSRMPNDLLVHDGLFELTKDFYKADELFTTADKLDISEATFRRIVKELERFDLAKTGDDIKGLAFERFLGTTFRGELGQFFTPRPVVEFMVDLLNPTEGELVCDPAAGSGGFLIRTFEHVRALIQQDVQAKKDAERTRIEELGLPEEEEEQKIEAAFATLNQELLPSGPDNKPIDTRVGRLAWKCIYGTDAEPRAARTAKMNMVMHGDGHGGIHYHDGLVDINGIFDGRFDVVLTNPPFGSNVGKDQVLGGSEETRIPTDPVYVEACKKRYGKAWEENHNRLLQLETEDTPILDLFDIGFGKPNRPTELIFVERCLNLLKPGGRMGIVLPDGNLNNPSLAWLRRYAEGRAKLLAVVSLPEETFRSSDATVKASLVFMTKFTDAEAASWEAAWEQAHSELTPTFNAQRDVLHTNYAQRITTGNDKTVGELLAKLAKLGINRLLPVWTQSEPPAYPRGTGPTQQIKPLWQGVPVAKDKVAAAQLKRDAQAALTIVTKAGDALLSELKAKYREVDAAHTAALWARVRELFDYPVFAAAPKAVGITSTGETGEGITNHLTDVLAQFRQFEQWLGRGAPEQEQPNFPEPSTA
jgi:type I restriction enzyme M protein